MSATPRYQQLKDAIIRRIGSGELQPLDRVPSENEWALQMNVSRMTANRALRELTDEGYLDRVAGSGTFVRDFRSRSDVLEVRDIAEEIALRGHRHRSSVVRNSMQRARGEVARALQVAQGEPIVHLLLVHYEDDVPVQVEDRHVVADFAPGCVEQDFTRQTPSAYLTSVAPLAEAEQVVRAAMPNAAVRRRLDIAASEPCLVVLRRTWVDRRPVTFARLHHPGSRYELAGHYRLPGTPPMARAATVQLEDLKR